MHEWLLPGAERLPPASTCEQRQVSLAAEGSLSSAASSSGCSSAAECSSTETARALTTAPPPLPPKQPLATRSANHLVRTPPSPGDLRRAAPMSEFSAASLRKSLRSATAPATGAASGISGARRPQLSQQLRRAATFRRPPEPPDYCCCCSGDCRRPSTSFIGGGGFGQREALRGSQAARPPRQATVASHVGHHLRAPTVRRPVPVPPPVVPLYKEMALLTKDRDEAQAEESMATPLLASSAHDLPNVCSSSSSADGEASPSRSSSSSNGGGGGSDAAERPFTRSYGDNWRELRAAHSRLDIAQVAQVAQEQQEERRHLTRTLGRRTGRLLGRLKQSLLDNFAAPSSSPVEAAPPAVNPQTIYDTPEYDASGSASNGQRTMRCRAQRPAIPPPPPPPQPNRAMSDGDCALERRDDLLVAVSFESISLERVRDVSSVSDGSGYARDRDNQDKPEQTKCESGKDGLQKQKQQQQQQIGRCQKAVKWAANSQSTGRRSEAASGGSLSRQVHHDQPDDHESAQLRAKKGILLKQLQRKLSNNDSDSASVANLVGPASKPDRRMGAQTSDLLDKSAVACQKGSSSSLSTSSSSTTSAGNGRRPTNGHVKLTSCDVSIKSLSLMTSKLVCKQAAKTIIGGGGGGSGSGSAGASGESPATTSALLTQTATVSQLKTNGPQQTGYVKLKGRSNDNDNLGSHKTRSARRQSLSASGNASASMQHQQQQQQKPLLPSIEESLEKRRKSIQNGDVFIYPSLYKHLNECPKCLRDNRVCNCNPLDLWQDRDDDSNGSRCSVSEASSGLTAKKLTERSATSSRETRAFGIDKVQVEVAKEARIQSLKQQQQQQMKSVYKISIASATIDQKSNQLRSSPATAIVPDSTSSQPSAAPSCLRASSPATLNGKASSSYTNDELLQPAVRPRTMLRERSRQQQQHHLDETLEVVNYSSSPDFNQVVAHCKTLSEPTSLTTQNGSSRTPPDGATGGSCVERSNERTKSANALQSNGLNLTTTFDSSLSAQQKPQKSHLKAPLVHSDSLDQSRLYLFSSEIERNEAEKYIQNSIPSSHSSSSSNKTTANGRCEAKFTAVSIGSSTRSTANVDLEKILSPSLVKGRAIGSNKLTSDINNNSDITNKDTTEKGREREEEEEENNLTNCDIRRSVATATEIQQNNSMGSTKMAGLVGSGKKQLTYNPDIGDAIKITSASIRLAANPLVSCDNGNAGKVLSDRTHTSVVPIQTLSSRRKNINSRLSRQVIHEDDDSGEGTTTCNQQPPQQIQLLTNPLLVADSAIADNSETNSDVLEYSPILSSVRDYIQNVNTKLQVQSASTSPIPVVCDELALSSFPVESSLVVTSISQPSSAIAVSETIQTNPGIVQTTTFTTINNVELDSPKKSIFEGASKDEILEYLEDARERVPDILMAADDVMVINENELIVVNQLEPNSPATPISIVEATEVIDSTKTSVNSIADIQTHPDQLRQHLQHMFRTSQLSGSLKCSSTDNTVDEDNCATLDHNSSPLSRLESTFDSVDVPSTPSSQLYEPRKVASAQKSFSCMTGATLESIDDQVAAIEVPQSINRSATRTTSSTSQSTASGDSQPVAKSSEEPVVEDGANDGDGLNITSFDSTALFSTRRNSLSDNSNQMTRVCELRMMKLQQRYSNRDSISSASSTPPSSTSPSSSTSSNQTSGNCSAASTFYASSSLSCSSPLLASSLTSNSPAFYKCPTIGPSSLSKYNFDTGPTYGVQILESLIREVKVDSSVDVTDLRIPPVDADDPRQEVKSAASVQDRLIKSRDTEGINGNHNVDVLNKKLDTKTYQLGDSNFDSISSDSNQNFKQDAINLTLNEVTRKGTSATVEQKNGNIIRFNQPTFSSSANLMSRTLPGHYASRLNNYFMNRHPLGNTSETTIEFQCLDCDQFIDVDQVTISNKTNEIRLLNERDTNMNLLNQDQGKSMSPDQLDRAYIAAMNGLPLCKSCEKKRIERKEIISEFVETELKYGRDLKIIHDEFYRPMQIAGLLSKDQIRGVFLNLEELILAHCKFADRLETAISEAHSMGDTDYNTVNIGRLFVESAEMLNTFESYCIRQGSAACLLARLAKEKELLRIFLRVSQIENTLLRRMNLAAFLMVPVQRVTKYPLLINRLYKVTAYHHKDREALRDAQLKVELHLEHINQQTKGVGATNKIWRRISNLSAPISSRPRLINAEDIGYIKLRKTAMDMLKWDRDETQFIHSGRINFAPLNEFLIKQKMKPLRYMAAHALLIVLGKPNWRYRPDLVKSNLDNKLMTPTPGGNGVKETALLLFREKNGRFVPCREPLYLSNCVFSADCSQFNSECPLNQPNHLSGPRGSTGGQCGTNSCKPMVSAMDKRESSSIDSRASSTDLNVLQVSGKCTTRGADGIDQRSNSVAVDSLSMSSMKSLPDDQSTLSSSPPTVPSSRSYSLASALPRTTITTNTLAPNLTKSTSSTSSNLTILNQLMTKVNSYHKLSNTASKVNSSDQNKNSTSVAYSLLQPEIHNQTQITIEPLSSNSSAANNSNSNVNSITQHGDIHQSHYNHHYFHNHHHPYGDYEESFEIHERISKESILLRADTPLKTRYWLQMLRYHAKDLGQWRIRRNALANIMMMRHE